MRFCEIGGKWNKNQVGQCELEDEGIEREYEKGDKKRHGQVETENTKAKTADNLSKQRKFGFKTGDT